MCVERVNRWWSRHREMKGKPNQENEKVLRAVWIVSLLLFSYWISSVFNYLAHCIQLRATPKQIKAKAKIHNWQRKETKINKKKLLLVYENSLDKFSCVVNVRVRTTGIKKCFQSKKKCLILVAVYYNCSFLLFFHFTYFCFVANWFNFVRFLFA